MASEGRGQGRRVAEQTSSVLAQATIALSALFLVAIVGIMAAGISARIIFHASLPWSEELARICLVWVAFLGGVAATCTGSQIRVNSLPTWVYRKSVVAGRCVDGLTLLLSILAVWIWAYASWELFGPSAGARSPATGIPAFYTRIALPVSCLFLTVGLVAQFVVVLLGGQRPDAGRDNLTEDIDPVVEQPTAKKGGRDSS